MTSATTTVVTGRVRMAWTTGENTTWRAMTYRVETPELPKAPSEEAARALLALRSVCHSMKRFAAPPRTVYVWTHHEDGTSREAGPVSYRAGVGYCHGSGILKVALPPEGTEFEIVREDV